MTKRLSPDERLRLAEVMGLVREACSMLARELRADPETANQAVFRGRELKELNATFRELERDTRRYETTLESSSIEEQSREVLVSDMWTMADVVAVLGWVYGHRALRELERYLLTTGAEGEGLGRARELFASAIRQLDLARELLEQRLRASGLLNQKA